MPTAENKVIVARLPQYKGISQEQIESALRYMEGGPFSLNYEPSTFPINQSPIPTAWVAGTSLREIFEKVLGKPCYIGGPNGDIYIRHELERLHNIVPIVVNENTLRGLNEMKPENLPAAMRALTGLPIEFTVEKYPLKDVK